MCGAELSLRSNCHQVCIGSTLLTESWKYIAVFRNRTGPHPEADGFIGFSLLLVLKITLNINPPHPTKPSSATISLSVSPPLPSLRHSKLSVTFLGLFLREKNCRKVTPISHLHIVLCSRLTGAVHVFLHTFSRSCI